MRRQVLVEGSSISTSIYKLKYSQLCAFHRKKSNIWSLIILIHIYEVGYHNRKINIKDRCFKDNLNSSLSFVNRGGPDAHSSTGIALQCDFHHMDLLFQLNLFRKAKGFHKISFA